MQLLVEKIILLVLLFLLGFGAGFGPYLLRNRCMSPSRCRDKLVSLLNCFSAGVFFATFFLHMMPEAQEEFSAVFGEEVEYPFAELLVSGGFFFVMVIEQIVMEWFGRKQSIKTSICDSEKCDDSNNSCDQECDDVCSLTPTSGENNCLVEDKGRTPSPIIVSKSLSLSKIVTNLENINLFDNHTDKFLSQTETVANLDIKKLETMVSLKEELVLNNDSSEHDHFDPQFNVRSFILLFALSTHALFEGLAIGFQNSASALRSLMFAVVIHKMALAFSFGISLVNSRATLVHVLLSMIVFSIMAPIGIGIGTALNLIKSANILVEMVVALMQAFAAGTFVYIIFIEIIPHELVTAKSEKRLLKLLFLGIGFAAMAGLQAIPHEEE